MAAKPLQCLIPRALPPIEQSPLNPAAL